MTDDELRRLAEAATPGPWTWNAQLNWFQVRSLDAEIVAPDCEDDARYLAAVSPDVVLGLLNRLDALEAQADDVRVRFGWCIECNSNTSPTWCSHSREAGRDLHHVCGDEPCGGLPQ